ncbi:hypothetical protein KKA27_00525, partial [Patescibacteria group bacterium]|nr:hypothetical protein [Patescibacteria group bacterium]
MTPDFITLKEAAEIHRCTQRHLSLLCRQEKIRADRVGKKWYTKKEWVDEYFLNDKNDRDVVVEPNITKINNKPLRRLSFVMTIIAILASTAFADASLGYPISSFVTSEVRLLKEVGLQNIDSVTTKSDFVVEEVKNGFVMFPQNVKEVFQETTLAIKQKQKDISDSIYDKSVFALGRFTTTIQLAR